MTVPYPPVTGDEPCRQDPDAFFPESSSMHAPREAKALCACCDIQQECLAYALTVPVTGVWGGTTEKDRRHLRREMGAAPVVAPTDHVDHELVLRSLERRMPVDAVAQLAGTTPRHVMRIRAEARRRYLRTVRLRAQGALL